MNPELIPPDKTQADFRILFEGEAFDEGAIKDLAAVLLSFSSVIEAANTALHKDRVQARVTMKAVHSGSFEVVLSLVTDSLDWVAANPEPIAAAHQILDLVIKSGKVIGMGMGVLGVLMLLGGRKPKKIEPAETGTSTITNADNHSARVNDSVITLVEDPSTRQAIHQFAQAMKNIPGLKCLLIRRRDQSGRTSEIRIDRDNAAFLKSCPEIPEEIKEETREAWLSPVTIQFGRHSKKKWSFREGGAVFNAHMNDQDFQNKVATGAIALSAHDRIHCHIRETHILSTTAGKKKENKEITIDKVIEHCPGSSPPEPPPIEQENLFSRVKETKS